MSKIKTEKPANRENRPVTSQAERMGVPHKVLSLIQREDYVAAHEALRALPRSLVVSQAMGVCVMRIGNAAEAVNLFRTMSVVPGTTVLKPEADDTLKVNYATALMMNGLPSGALDLLDELEDPCDPMALQIRAAIRKWANGLVFWRRWDWKLNRIDPPRCFVPFDFTPGVYPFDVSRTADKQVATPASPGVIETADSTVAC
ncbi:MAG: tetratricopeptide repeat protein [Rhodopirellula sp. JB044]|uniref:tetratricopeptide repeat protein n=1 Tax=Rhodopirellula sp. JB044 TaxID=3342844 RepID=UPI00370A0B70